MRGATEGLASPYPLATLLPGVLQEDPFTTRFVSGLDDVLAPVISCLDSLYAYLEPGLAPADFVRWLASWVGESTDENWPLERQRATVSAAVELQRRRGTVGGLRAELELVTGGDAEVADSGGVSWSQTPDTELPGEEVARLAVRVTVSDPDGVDAGALEAVLRSVKPAHVAHRLEVRSP